MKKKALADNRIPAPRGPYSQAVSHSGLLFISGQIPLDPNSNEIVHGTIEEEALIALDNLKAVVENKGRGLADVLKVNCYLSDINDFSRFNAVYSDFFPKNPPARSCVQVAALPGGVKVEVDAIVALKNKRKT